MDITQPLRCSVHVEQIGDDLSLRRWTGSLGSAVFVSLWLTVWTVGCVRLAGIVARQPTLEHILCAVLCGSSWVIVAGILPRLLFGIEHLRIGPDGLEYRSRALVTLSRRRVPLDEIRGIIESEPVTDPSSGGVLHGLKIVTRGRPFRFGQSVDPREQLWLADLILGHLSRLVPGPVPRLAEKEAVRIEVLHPGIAPTGPPCDGLLRMASDWGGASFVRRGAFRFFDLAGITFITLFWNGCVALFVLPLLKEFHWPLACFLIPFEAIGLALFVAWCAALTTPFRSEAWVFGPDEIVSRVTAFGLGWARRVEASEVVRVELRKNARSRKRLVQTVANDEKGDAPFTLGFVGQEGRDLLAIDDLTEGEARWMGGSLCASLKGSLSTRAAAPRTTLASDPLWDRELDR